jgi:hypothetical protein
MSISDTFFFTSSVEAPKLQSPPETFVPSTEKTLLLKEQPKNGLRASGKAVLTRLTLRARGGVSGGIWRGLSIMNYLRGTRPSLLNAIVHNFAIWRKQSSKNARVGDMECFFKHDNAGPRSANMTKVAIQELDWEILPHPLYSPDLAPSDYHLFRFLSNNLRGVSFKNDAELQNLLADFTAKPGAFFKRGIENLPKRWEAVVNNGEYIID